MSTVGASQRMPYGSTPTNAGAGTGVDSSAWSTAASRGARCGSMASQCGLTNRRITTRSPRWLSRRWIPVDMPPVSGFTLRMGLPTTSAAHSSAASGGLARRCTCASLPVVAVTIDDVLRAAKVLDGVAVRTPVLRSDALDERLGATVLLKAECLQRGGAF